MCLMVAKLAGRCRCAHGIRVHDPVQAVFDHPMTADHRSNLAGEQDQRVGVEAHLTIDLVADLPCALDHDDAFRNGPIVPFM